MTALPSLIPAARAKRAGRTRRRARWASVIAIAGALAASVCVPALFQTGARYLTIGEETRSLDAMLVLLNERIAIAEAEADATRAQLEIAQSVTRHPDWSLLFPILAEAIAGRAAIDAVAIEPSPSDTGYQITLRGRAEGPRVVSDVALSLESTPLISVARVESTNRVNENAAAFLIRCVVTPRAVDSVTEVSP